MGLFDFNKKDNKLEEALKKIALIIGEEDKEFFEEYSKGIKDLAQIPFGSLDLFEQVIKMKNDSSSLESHIKESKSFYNKIVFDKNDKTQEKLFIALLGYVQESKISDQNAIRINSLFSDKGLLLNFINNFETYSVQEIKSLIEYMSRARQYFVDDNAFVSSCITLCEKLNDSPIYSSFDEIIEDKIKEDMQLAGIYNIGPDEINALVSKYRFLEKELNEIDCKNKEAIKKINNLKTMIKKIEGLSEEKSQEILDEISTYATAFKKEKDIVKASISEVGENYLNLIHKEVGANPAIKRSPLFNKVDDKPIAAFDSKTPLLERFKNAKLQKSGLYHYCFDDALKHILVNKCVYLVGPGGTGKTTIVSQLADLLGLKFYNIGFVADEITSIKGYLDAEGNFVNTPFYTAFKEGGIFFLDEIDNSESKALIELNKFVSNIGYKPYLFPNGEIVSPNPNFRLVAAGNTWGDGADISYSTRESLDASTLRRLARVECGYDTNLEKNMFDCNDQDMFDFCMLFRNALNERDGQDEFSTGDLVDINNYLKSGIFDDQEIMKLIFIRNRRIETLQNIISIMANNMSTDNKYYSLFKRMVNNKKDVQYVKRSR